MGGSGTASNDPDIALGCFCWSSPQHPVGERRRQSCVGACNNSSDSAAADHIVAAAPSATITPIRYASPAPDPVLVRVTASQEGDVPAARIGHSAVTLPNPSPRSPPSSRTTSTSIFVFGGEAANPSTADDNGSGPPSHPKFADVYEATPKTPSGTLVWRALTPPRVPAPRDPTTIDTEPIVTHDFPAPVAFHASCSASVCGAEGGNRSGGTERALLVHGGINQSSEMLADLWAFVPTRRSNASSNDGVVDGGDGSGAYGNSNGDGTTGWELLQPQGEG